MSSAAASDPAAWRISFDNYKDYERVKGKIKDFAIHSLREQAKSVKTREKPSTLEAQMDRVCPFTSLLEHVSYAP